jgi:hypothetical protein
LEGVRRAADAGEASRNLSTNIQPLNHIHDSICFILPVINNATFAFFKPNSALRRFSHRFTPIFIPTSIAIKAYTYSVKQLELEESRSH